MTDVTNMTPFEEVELLLQSLDRDEAVAPLTEGDNTNKESNCEAQEHSKKDLSTSNTPRSLKRKSNALYDESAPNTISSLLDGTVTDSNSSKTLQELKAEYTGTPERVTTEIPDNLQLDKLTCPYCFKKYPNKYKKNHHVKQIHNVLPKLNQTTCIKCVECNILFKHKYNLRDHLRIKHDMNMDMHELKFPNIEAFNKWKQVLERKELAKFVKRSSKKTTYGHKWFFECHRSGKPVSKIGEKRIRRGRSYGSVKMGIECSAAIVCKEYKDGDVDVQFWPTHYGHGQETSYRQLDQVEIDAIHENISNGVDYENIIGNMHEDTASFQAILLRQKDTKVILKAFDSEDYYSGLSDAEGVDRFVRICSQLEDSPVLYYRNDDNNFCLIIMTEFQRNILLSSNKHMLCVDNDIKRKNSRFYFISLMALDEREIAFPVAFCVSENLDKAVIRQFLMSVRDATGPLSCQFFMSDSNSFYLESWQEVMEDSPVWLWSMWHVDDDFQGVLKPLKGMTAYRAEFYKLWRLLLECQNTNLFETMHKSLANRLLEEPRLSKRANTMWQKYSVKTELWGYCYHKDVKLSSAMQFETLHRTMVFSSIRGRKARLDKFIVVILKLMKFKLLHRLTCMLDEEKTSLALKSISTFHQKGFQIPSESISSLGDKLWMINCEEEEGNVYVVHEFDSCPERCDLKCPDCDICVHMYSCTCMHNLIYADLCPHIHAVVWKFLAPHFSPMPSPAHDHCEDSMDTSSASNQPSELVETVMNLTHDLFKKIRSNKSTLSETVLNAMKYRINEMMDMCSKNEVIDSQMNPPNVLKTSKTVVVQNLQSNPRIVSNANLVNVVPQTVNTQPQFVLPYPIRKMPANPTPPFYVILPKNLNLANLKTN